LLSLATLEGARAVGLDRHIGNFAVGKAADFVVVDDLLSHPLYPRLGRNRQELGQQLEQRQGQTLATGESALERLSRVISRPHPDAVRETWIEGTKVFSRKG
jgi:cytosine/adenosine deaminase-related metal-dependent hydrolase